MTLRGITRLVGLDSSPCISHRVALSLTALRHVPRSIPFNASSGKKVFKFKWLQLILLIKMQGKQTEEMEGVESTHLDTGSAPLMREDEKHVLELYDRLEELQLEIALLKEQGVFSKGSSILERYITTVSNYMQMKPQKNLKRK
jgi:hypothetical protein